MNKKRKSPYNKIRNNDRADLGVATLIIFMAMILIAALAASMILYSGGALQKKAINRSDFVIQDSCVEERLGDFVTGYRTVDSNNTNGTYNNSDPDFLNRNDSTCIYTRYNYSIK
jgi:hypothetical protein